MPLLLLIAFTHNRSNILTSFYGMRAYNIFFCNNSYTHELVEHNICKYTYITKYYYVCDV